MVTMEDSINLSEFIPNECFSFVMEKRGVKILSFSG